MTTPPQPPQGPYGAPQGPYGPPPQPPQDNPYGQQSPYGRQSPYGQQSPYAPQGPYAQQPVAGPPPFGYPQGPPQQPFGFPQGPPPPRKRRTGLIVGITVGALVVAGGIVFGVSRLADAGQAVAGRGFPAAEYRLTVPKKLLDDEYTLLKDSSSTDGREIEETYDPSIRDAKAVVTQYTSSSGGTLIVSGLWGRIKKPEFSRDKILEGATQTDGMTIAVPAREFTPDGYGITVSCQVMRSKGGGITSTLPMCAWGDGNTAAFVAVVTPESASQDPEKVDLGKAALDTARVRAESRRPITAAGGPADSPGSSVAG
ncbi:hypothetical protein EDD93_0448 [Streptomyces sp. 840.1]|uniref:hypothetical protein n=1 Tax=Streptomyces sp. 840.1 TaxID=2485152 RepID=UPI000F48F8CA|nr:hypothetical protein [Streptomyces sp. 840.1]ROQ66048.1 hypothetical protein EDD93_0448 [Streptomyces sp. 840.1]